LSRQNLGSRLFQNNLRQNITVIQSESFFDARRLDSSIKSSVLENYDRCKTESMQYGKLNVPAWGANTMRTEFSFLTGLNYDDMGFYRYYPYQYVHQLPVTSLATYLKSQGYYCVCIHPHPASFFGRDRIFPKLGFDAFIDIESFDKKDTFGPYISDKAVTEKIIEITHKNNDKPLFIFAITMENHGPLHLEKTTVEEQSHFFDKAPIAEINDLTVYLRHLKNADKMIADLCSAYRQIDQASCLCFYGDHIPSMPKIYQELDYNDQDSDYFIWDNSTNNDDLNSELAEKSLAVDALAKTLLGLSGNLNHETKS
jgi:phosphoglycerol transferase MdoB-like AlkP superfamily enzyme